MTANPRKFSEKIALQQQKQAEGTAAYEQIMREVLATTRLAIVKPMQPKQDASIEHHSNPNGGTTKEAEPGSSINLKNALMNLEDIKHSIDKPQMSYSPNLVNVMGGHSREQSPMRHLHPQQHSKRKKFSADRHRDFSPYASPHLLTLDPGWRRVCSDSAIHATVQSGRSKHSTALEQRGREVTPNQNMNILTEKNLRPRSCEMAGLNVNGYTGFPQQAYPNVATVNNTLSIPSQTQNSGSLPNINSSALHNSNPSDHSKCPYIEGSRCNHPMTDHLACYMATTRGAMAMQPTAICLGNLQQQQSSYLDSLCGHMVGSMPSQNGHFIFQQQDFMVPSNVPGVIGYQEVSPPPPYPHPKSSSLPPTSPPPSITLTDVGCPGRPLETILLESPAEDMYSPSWERFLQSPQSRAENASPNSRFLLGPSGIQLSQSNPIFTNQMGPRSFPSNHNNTVTLQATSSGNQWAPNVNNVNIGSDIEPPNHAAFVVNNAIDNNNIHAMFGAPSVPSKIEPPPSYESATTHAIMALDHTQNPDIIGQAFAASKRNPLVRQEAIMPQNVEDFPSLSCLGDSFEDVELMNAEDLKLEPLEIEDLNLLATLSCTINDEEFFSLDKNC